ncbi:hypothetical protein FKX98_07070 [Bifidobacterium breve]|nr:hypothetical protein [Bifidobacterium breve]
MPEANPTRRLCRIGTCWALAVPSLAGAVGGADWGGVPAISEEPPLVMRCMTAPASGGAKNGSPLQRGARVRTTARAAGSP